MTLREQLIKVSDIYATARGVGRQRVSTLVLNRGSTLDRLASGAADVTTGTYEAALLWFSRNWPAEVEWPLGVYRPTSEAAE